MADLKPIDFPEYLNRHALTEQELIGRTPENQALAKDWNIINRKMDWVMAEMVTLHNILVQHDQLLDTFKKWLWLSGLAIGGGGATGGFLWFILKHGGG